MDASDLIKGINALRKDGIDLPTEKEDMEYLQKIGFKFFPSKSSFEQLLGQSVILLDYMTSTGQICTALCTSNKTLINISQKTRLIEKKKLALEQNGILIGKSTKELVTWDLIKNHIIKIPLTNDFNLKAKTIKYKILLRPDPKNYLAVDMLLRNLH